MSRSTLTSCWPAVGITPSTVVCDALVAHQFDDHRNAPVARRNRITKAQIVERVVRIQAAVVAVRRVGGADVVVEHLAPQPPTAR